MIVYEGIKKEFRDSVRTERIADEIRENILQKLGRHTADNEYVSWVNSLRYMSDAVGDPEIPEDAGIAIEFNIPQTAKRVDFMISGYDENGNPGWSSLN